MKKASLRQLVFLFGLALQFPCNSSFAFEQGVFWQTSDKLADKTGTGSRKKKLPKSFERERTQKLNFEPIQLSNPESPGSVVVDESKARELKEAIGKKQKEVDRLNTLIESGRQMLAESGDNRSARIKISGSLSLLETELQRIKAEIDALESGMFPQQASGSAVDSNGASPTAGSVTSSGSADGATPAVLPTADPDADYTLDEIEDPGSTTENGVTKTNK